METVENENANIGLASAAANLPDAPQMGSSTTTVVTKRKHSHSSIGTFNNNYTLQVADRKRSMPKKWIKCHNRMMEQRLKQKANIRQVPGMHIKPIQRLVGILLIGVVE